jgi:hypothetical protein
VLVFDYLFVPPFHTIAVADSQYLITMIVTLVVALLLSTMATRLREQAQFARRREERNAALYRLSRELAASADPADLLAAAARSVESVFDAPVASLLPDAEGRVVPRTGGLVPLAAAPHERAVAVRPRRGGGPGRTRRLPPRRCISRSSAPGVGVLGIRPADARTCSAGSVPPAHLREPDRDVLERSGPWSRQKPGARRGRAHAARCLGVARPAHPLAAITARPPAFGRRPGARSNRRELLATIVQNRTASRPWCRTLE